MTDVIKRREDLPIQFKDMGNGTFAEVVYSESQSSTEIDAALGAPADAAATTDTGTFSLIALKKRGLQNWTALLARIPALVSGRMPVDGSGVTQPVSANALPLPNGAATQTTLASVDAKIPAQAIPGLLPVDTLAAVGLARQLPAGATNVNTALTTTARRISIHARLGDVRYAVGTGTQTASATSHYIAVGERLDLDIPASAQIAVIRAGATDAVLEVSELTL
jgi:hypothetical protein